MRVTEVLQCSCSKCRLSPPAGFALSELTDGMLQVALMQLAEELERRGFGVSLGVSMKPRPGPTS